MRRSVVAAGAVFLLALGVYALSLAPDLTWAHWGADGGDFVTAAVTGRLSHPPGFSLYMGLARAFVRLPWGTPAWRLNLLSAVMAAATAAMFAGLLWRRGYDLAIVLITALSLAFAPLFWSQALITEVTTTAAFFAVLTLALVCRLPDTPRRAFVDGWVWGLGLAVHPTLAFLAPLWWGTRRRLLPALACGMAVGLLPYALLPVMGVSPQPWGDLRAAAGWWEYVTARLYWGYAFALPLADWPRRLLAWAVLSVKQFTPVGAALALMGMRFPERWEKRLVWRTGLAFGAVSLYAIGYNTTDSLVYLTPFLVLPALWLAEGLAWLVQQPGLQRARWLGLVLPLAALLWHWSALDLRQDLTARQWWEATLAQTPANAVLVTAADAQTFALWYAQEALGLRPDVTVVDRDLWARSSYREFLALPAEQAVASIEALAAGRALCYVESTTVTCP